MTIIESPELVLDAQADLAEGPLWDVERQSLLWVDIPAGEVHRYTSTQGDALLLRLDVPVGAVVKRFGGGLVLAAGLGFATCDDDGGGLEWMASVTHGTRMNDGACDPAGRFWAGTWVDRQQAGGAELYRLEGDHHAVQVLGGVTVSNGIDWSPDARTMYYVDTPTELVEAFDYDVTTGGVVNRRPFVDLHEVPGRPDGLAVDAEGGVWVAMANGWAVRRFDPSGAPDVVVDVPAQKVTSCAFGGPELNDLYITTASVGLSAEERKQQPHAGGIFRVRTGFTGMAPQVFRG